MNMKYEELLLNLKIRPQDQLFGHVGILFGLVVIHFIKGLGRSIYFPMKNYYFNGWLLAQKGIIYLGKWLLVIGLGWIITSYLGLVYQIPVLHTHILDYERLVIVNLIVLYGLMLSGVLSNRKVYQQVFMLLLYVTLSLILIEKGTYMSKSAGQGGLLAGPISDVLAIGDLVAYSDAIVNKWKRHLYVTLSGQGAYICM